MARNASDREDLLREATALVERAEVELPQLSEHCVFGFRRNGALSLFLGSDPVWQFNPEGQLRRGFFAGCLLKAHRGRLVRLAREQADEATYLRSTPVDEPQLQQILTRLEHDLDLLADALKSQSFRLIGAVPDQNVLDRMLQWCLALSRPVRVAAGPRVGSREP